MDVDLNESQKAVPIAPITFKGSIPSQVQIIPVVYIVNNTLKNQTEIELEQLAHNILWFAKEKVLQSGKKDYEEIQIDCDWTQVTREKYFSLLQLIKKNNSTRLLSCTLRLHQLKNQATSGIPPVDKVLLMCYNMGNLRRFGTQNSILDLAELQKYAGKNLASYPMAIDIALPLFSWSVVFDHENYIGISKRLSLTDLKDPMQFMLLKNGLYQAKANLATFGIKQNQMVRHEESKLEDLQATAEYLTDFLSEKPINLVYYHLDEEVLKNYPYHELEEINHIFY